MSARDELPAKDAMTRTQAGYMEDVSFVRLRELSVRYQLPASLLTRSRFAKDASLSFSMRNVRKWTRYTGIDPEANSDAGTTANLPSDFQALGPPSYYILRLNLGF